MKILNEWEDLSMHHHKLNEGHEFATVNFEEVDVKNLDEGYQHLVSLIFIRGVIVLLILEFKILFILEKERRQSQDVNKQWQQDDYWAEEDGTQELNNALTFVRLPLVVEIDVEWIADAFDVKEWNQKDREEDWDHDVDNDH